MKVAFEFDFEKALEALVYLASRTEDVTGFDKYKAGKLLFLADKYHLVQFGRPIVGGEYRALEFGPIPQNIVDLLHILIDQPLVASERTARLAEALRVDRTFHYPRLHAAGAPRLETLSESDLGALNHVAKLHGRKSFEELKALTHHMVAYQRPWQAKGEGINMALMAYEDFFEEDADSIEGAYEEMLENAQFREAFPDEQPA